MSTAGPRGTASAYRARLNPSVSHHPNLCGFGRTFKHELEQLGTGHVVKVEHARHVGPRGVYGVRDELKSCSHRPKLVRLHMQRITRSASRHEIVDCPLAVRPG